MSKKATTKNFEKVLGEIQRQFKNGESVVKKHWVTWLNESLDELLHNDFFGTEGQLDPRGDNRE